MADSRKAAKSERKTARNQVLFDAVTQENLAMVEISLVTQSSMAKDELTPHHIYIYKPLSTLIPSETATEEILGHVRVARSSLSSCFQTRIVHSFCSWMAAQAQLHTIAFDLSNHIHHSLSMGKGSPPKVHSPAHPSRPPCPPHHYLWLRPDPETLRETGNYMNGFDV